ncbi:MAG: alpha amylase C-terminal domain-containing protein [Marinilabiliaceae bacterium]|nr:alpha amylase C-terminal domain-containing protein [Marinilabiliaceae bacterium]
MAQQIYQIDTWLQPYASTIDWRHNRAIQRIEDLKSEYGGLSKFADAYKYYGLHNENGSWVLREHAPNAISITIVGDFNGWQESEEYEMKRLLGGDWELFFPENTIKHGDKFKMRVRWNGGEGDRIPSYATRVVQDNKSYVFDAQAWNTEDYKWEDSGFVVSKGPKLIYEAHIGMSGEQEGVATYDDFRRNVLPHVVEMGYNVLQLMAIQEHPYYGSFGYHVSNFFAPSSRFGTPEELKRLIDEAHKKGVAVIMDIVHSHAVKNENEGISKLDGTTDLYFHYGDKGNHPAWDSRCFNYGKDETQRFLLSNCKYWIEEFHFDGFRFDGVTSMLYFDHGLGRDFTSYQDYFACNEDDDAILYLMLANCLIHEVKPGSITIAEEMSGFPGIAGKFEAGGIGFDYRLSMGVPDYWIKLIKETPDEQWPVGKIFYELQQHRPEELTINYAESHDQALVGDKTIIFRLIDKDMYTDMNCDSQNLIVDRGIALHKMIRMITLFTASGGYLTFMGNEFGHPEWIDFPREGNEWSYKYARRQWSLAHADYLRYHYLLDFEKAMIELFRDVPSPSYPYRYYDYDGSQVVAFGRGDYILVFNFSPTNSYTDYAIPVPKGRYNIVLSTDEGRFGGFDRNDMFFVFYSENHEGKDIIHLYLPARSALVLKRRDLVHIR